jgi:uncharacterized protein
MVTAALSLLNGENSRAEVLVAITWQCNLRCSYCFVRECGLSRNGEHLRSTEAIAIIDALDEGLSEAESICVHFYGGEPMLNLPAMEAMVNRAAQKTAGRFSFAITTNGTLISPAGIDLLRAGNFQVILSIDGPAPIHDACRRTLEGGPTHARVLEFLEALRSDTSCQIRGSAVVRSGWSLGQAVNYLLTLPVGYVKAQAVRSPASSPYVLSKFEEQAYLKDIEDIGRYVIGELKDGRAPRDDRFSSRVLQLLAGIERQTFCGAGETTFGITPAGAVLPCVLMNPEGCLLGHIHDDPQVWRQAGRNWRRFQTPRPACSSCEALPLCGGGCPALMPICGSNECTFVRKNCEVATAIYDHFRSAPEALLALAGIF